jgi:hypothetical protein
MGLGATQVFVKIVNLLFFRWRRTSERGQDGPCFNPAGYTAACALSPPLLHSIYGVKLMSIDHRCGRQQLRGGPYHASCAMHHLLVRDGSGNRCVREIRWVDIKRKVKSQWMLIIGAILMWFILAVALVHGEISWLAYRVLWIRNVG